MAGTFTLFSPLHSCVSESALLISEEVLLFSWQSMKIDGRFSLVEPKERCFDDCMWVFGNMYKYSSLLDWFASTTSFMQPVRDDMSLFISDS
jgi:hypothetical protein